MTNRLDDEVQRISATMDNQDQQGEEQGTQPEQTLHVHYFPDAIVILKEDEQQPAQVIDSTPVTPQKISFLPAYAMVFLYLLLIISAIAFQFYCIFNPPIATVTIIPKSQTVSLTGTMQLGRVLAPLTISRSQTTPATGKGHQIATAATGTVTFYNGLFTQQSVASGTVYTGSDGVAIVTTQDAMIPKGDPSSGYGTATVAAQAVEAGKSGNIQVGDINITINNGLLVRNNQFANGQNARTYTTVTHNDIHQISTVLKTFLTQSMQGALQGQLRSPEQLFILPCTPTITSDHPIGAEAILVKVTVSETCGGVAYNSDELEKKATAFLATQALHNTGDGYSLFGTVHVRVTQVTIQKQVIVSYDAQGTWLYALSTSEQQRIKILITSKTTQEAQHILQSLPGVKNTAISWGNAARLPKDTQYIHIRIVVA